jgi:hypothetical protein
MQEIWLRPNRRALLFGCAPLAAAVALGGWLAFGMPSLAGGWRWLGGSIMVLGVVAMALLLSQFWRPRIGYRDGHVLFYLVSGEPIGVPAEVVEAFFVAQGPATLPGGVGQGEQTYNLVARLSQRAAEWADRDVKPALGQWCGGYVTIRGTWCEPLDDEVIRRLNRRLKEVREKVEG